MRCVDVDAVMAVNVRSFERYCRKTRATIHTKREKRPAKWTEEKIESELLSWVRIEWMRINDTHSNGLRFYVHAFIQSWTSPCQIYRFSEVAECTQSGFPFRFKWILSGTNREKKGNEDLQTHTFHANSVDLSVDSRSPSFCLSFDWFHPLLRSHCCILCVPKHTLMYMQCSTKMIHACIKSTKFR